MEFLCSLWLLPDCWGRRWSLNRPKVAATEIVNVLQSVAHVTAKAEAIVVRVMAKVVESAVPAMVKVVLGTDRLAMVRGGQVTEGSAVVDSDLRRIQS